jgi:hypothetical protein
MLLKKLAYQTITAHKAMCLKTAQNKLSFLAERPRILLFCNILYFTRGAALSPAQGAWLNPSQRHFANNQINSHRF